MLRRKGVADQQSSRTSAKELVRQTVMVVLVFVVLCILDEFDIYRSHEVTSGKAVCFFIIVYKIHELFMESDEEEESYDVYDVPDE